MAEDETMLSPPIVPEQIDMRPVASLIPFATNARTHTEEQIAQIAASIREFGFTNPILVTGDDTIIAGHGRVIAARKLGMTEVPTVELGHLTPTQVKAYVIADNQLAMNAGWNTQLLALELTGLLEEDFDIDLIGFSEHELSRLMKPTGGGLTDPDAIPEPPAQTITQPGDVWILGNHKIVCGDAKIAAVWESLEVEDGIIGFTSPPYNLGTNVNMRDSSTIGTLAERESAYEDYHDEQSDGEYLAMLQAFLDRSQEHLPASVFNIQMLAGNKTLVPQWIDANRDALVDIITWDKGSTAPAYAESVMNSSFEWLVIFKPGTNVSRAVPLSSWRGTISNIYRGGFQHQNEFAKEHGATFPVHLPEFIGGDLMNRSRGMLDCCLGTGTTIIAAEALGKRGYGIDIDPLYCDITIQRWQQYTGQDATRDDIPYSECEPSG